MDVTDTSTWAPYEACAALHRCIAHERLRYIRAPHGGVYDLTDAMSIQALLEIALSSTGLLATAAAREVMRALASVTQAVQHAASGRCIDIAVEDYTCRRGHDRELEIEKHSAFNSLLAGFYASTLADFQRHY